MDNVTLHPTAERDSVDNTQMIDGGDYDRLWRAQQAAALLAAMNNAIAADAGICHDNTAAVAEYIRDDMLEILNHSQPVNESP